MTRAHRLLLLLAWVGSSSGALRRYLSFKCGVGGEPLHVQTTCFADLLLDERSTRKYQNSFNALGVVKEDKGSNAGRFTALGYSFDFHLAEQEPLC